MSQVTVAETHGSDERGRDDDADSRPSQKREISVNDGGLPTSASAIRAIALALYQAGYDGREPDDMHQLADDLRAWREAREEKRQRAASHKTWRVVIISSIATIGGGALIQWLPPFLRFLFAQPPHHGPQ